MGNHVHGRPDNQEENLDDLLGRGPGDFDLPSGGRWIGTDLPEVSVSFLVTGRGEGYPWTENIDYDPRFDEDLESND